MFKTLSLSLLLASGLVLAQKDLPLIPFPQEITQNNGKFILDKEVTIITTGKNFESEFLQQQLQSQFGIHLPIKSKSTSGRKTINLVLDNTLANEAYTFASTNSGVTIKGRSGKELFYGIQTLLQLIPANSKNTAELALVNIKDQPKFPWRGMHLDVGRHFFPIDFIKKYIDFLAMYKMNTFHWHLTEDQGWRLEIKKYPKLTEVGAWRDRSMVGHYNENRYDERRYGGFYTQEQAKEIVRYAAERHITVIPEIELPGHASAAVAAYPEYGCTGKQIKVADKWGVLEDIFCPSEQTFTFLEDVLTEVMEIFPSKIIHIGGDEAPKTQWKTSPIAQAVIKREGLKDEHHLQSYFIQRVEKFLNKHGREIIGWDEILEGGLAPNAKVMSWRGYEGGIEAATEKHDVVMTPTDFAYFDYYQGDAKNEPVAFGGYLPIEKVYSFNPIPKSLKPEFHKYILGSQGNLWTEYITTPERVEYMVFPRITAMAEATWGTNKNFKEFENRLFKHFKVLDKKNINYSKAIYEVKVENAVSKDKKAAVLTLKSAREGGEIRYTMDGTAPTNKSTIYKSPIRLEGDKTIKAAYFDGGDMKSAVASQSFYISKSFGKKVTLKNNPSEKYAAHGANTLVDGVKGIPATHNRDWLGFNGDDVDATIDLGEKQSFSRVSLRSIDGNENWIYLPQSVEILVSNDGNNFNSVKKISAEEIKKMHGVMDISVSNQNARFVKVLMKNHGIIADGHPGAGQKAWLFVDEILIN